MPIVWPAVKGYTVGETVRPDQPERTEYEGAVLDLGEMNYRDDSDFYAVVWDGERVRRVEYDTTRYGGGGTARVDATPETLAAAEKWLAEYVFQVLRRKAAEEATTVRRGKRVRAVRGRKVPVGTEGQCFWLGYNKFRAPRYGHGTVTEEDRVGVKLDNGETYFGDRYNWQAAAPGDDMPGEAELRAQAERTAKRHNWRMVGHAADVAFV